MSGGELPAEVMAALVSAFRSPRAAPQVPLEWMGVEPDDFNDESLQPELVELGELAAEVERLEEVHGV